MTIPKINSAHGSDTRNILNRAIDLINAQGKSIQDLVAEGQLTPAQYAQLISIINGSIKSGYIKTEDIDKNNFSIDETMIADSLRNIITGNAPVHSVPANNSITTEKYVDNSVTKRKKTVGGETALVLSPGKQPDIDLENKKFNIYQGTHIVHSKGRTDVLTDFSLDFAAGVSTVIIFDIYTKLFRSAHSGNSSLLSDDEVYIAHLVFNSATQSEILNVIGNLEYTVNGKDRIIKGSVHTDEVEDNAITPNKTNFLEIPNYYNKNDLIHRSYISSSTGEVVEGNNHNITKFIEIPEQVDMYFKYVGVVVYYDADKNIIRINTPIPIEGSSHKTPPGTKFARLSVNNIHIDKAMMYLGDKNKAYEPYSVKVLDIDVTRSEKKTLKFPPENIEAKFEAPDYEYRTFTLQEYYNAFDVLVSENPDRLTKTVLGKDESGEYDVIMHHYKPPTFEYAESKSNGEIPKILFISNIHGFEKPSALATYYMMKAILEDWRSNESIEYLSRNVEMVFIAISNPYGYVNNTYKNGNATNPVNLQRNFPIHWQSVEPSSTVYGGTEPMSEKETQYIANMLQENKDAMFFIDSHSAGDVLQYTHKDLVYYVGASAPADYDERIEESMKYSLNVVSRQLSKNYFPDFEGISGHYYLRPGNGSTEPYGGSLGIPTFVSETFYGLPGDGEQYKPLAIKAMTETFANTLLATLKTFKEYS